MSEEVVKNHLSLEDQDGFYQAEQQDSIIQQREEGGTSDTPVVCCSHCKCEQSPTCNILSIDWLGEKESDVLRLCADCVRRMIESEKKETIKLESEIDEIQQRTSQVEGKIVDATKQLERIFAQSSSNSNVNPTSQIGKTAIEELTTKQKSLDTNLDLLKERVLDFEIKEAQYWVNVNVFEKRLLALLGKAQIAKNLDEQHKETRNRLNKYNTINRVFSIDVSEQVGLINNLTIGKKLNEDINWDETNAGLGHVALLLVHLTGKFGYLMQVINYIEVSGNESCVCEKSRNEQLFLRGPLHNKEDESRFNKAMKLLLEELFYFTQFLIGYFPSAYIHSVELPFRIDPTNGTIDGLTLSTQQAPNSQYKGLDNWTQAFKKFLITLKYLIKLNAQYDNKKEIEILERE